MLPCAVVTRQGLPRRTAELAVRFLVVIPPRQGQPTWLAPAYRQSRTGEILSGALQLARFGNSGVCLELAPGAGLVDGPGRCGGVGPDGHLAFNEPGSSLSSKTRIKTLTTDTIIANSRFFDGDLSKVPSQALTVGIGTVMAAKEVLLVCNGHHKSRALKHIVDGSVSHKWTASMLQMHPHCIVVCDEHACDELTVGTYKYYLDKERGNL